MHNIKTSVNILARILAIDYGEKRTGIAVTDELQIIASGLTTVETKKIFSFLTDYLKTEKVELFIVGEPKQLNNTESESEKIIKPFVEYGKVSERMSYFEKQYPPETINIKPIDNNPE